MSTDPAQPKASLAGLATQVDGSPSGTASSPAGSDTLATPALETSAGGLGAAGAAGAVPEIPGVLLERALGRGGMGAVYQGRQVNLDRIVAVKVIHPDLAEDRSFVDRFEREAKVLAKLSHPNIVACFASGQAKGGEHYLLMEFVEGQDLLKQVQNNGALGERDALVLTRQVAEGLDHALELGVIHRDVKPENILLKKVAARTAQTSLGVQAKLVDLGLASLTRPDKSAVRLTQAGTAVGTPLTMAPEQATDPETIDHRADVYALGCVLYFALTGRFPHEGQTIAQVLAKKLKGETPSPTQHRPDLNPDVAALALRMMSFDRDARPATYDELFGLLDVLIARFPAIGARSTGAYATPAVVSSPSAGAAPSVPVAAAAPAGVAAATVVTTSSPTAPPLPTKEPPPPSGGAGRLVAGALVIALLGSGYAALRSARSVSPLTPPEGPPAPPTPAPAPSPSSPPSVDGESMSLFQEEEKRRLESWDYDERFFSTAEENGKVDVRPSPTSDAVATYKGEIPGDFNLQTKISLVADTQGGVRLTFADGSVKLVVLSSPDDRRSWLLRVKVPDPKAPVLKSCRSDAAEPFHAVEVRLAAGRLWIRLDKNAWESIECPQKLKALALYAPAKKGLAAAHFGDLWLTTAKKR